MKELFNSKIQDFIKITLNDERWDLSNEMMFQVFGYTLFGFSSGIGRNLYFMEFEEITDKVISELTELGAGENYVRGLVKKAQSTFENKTTSYESDLVGIGFSHFASENLNELKESVFSNTILLREDDEKIKPENPSKKEKKKWWKFGK